MRATMKAAAPGTRRMIAYDSSVATANWVQRFQICVIGGTLDAEEPCSWETILERATLQEISPEAVPYLGLLL